MLTASPSTSPRSVAALWIDHPDSKAALSLPAFKHHTVEQNKSIAAGAFVEYKPYYGLFSLKPANHILQVFHRIVMPANPRAAMSASEAFMQDVLVNQCNFTKAEHMYVGELQGRRMVLAHMGGDEYGISCVEQNPVQMFLMALRTMNVQVGEQT